MRTFFQLASACLLAAGTGAFAQTPAQASATAPVYDAMLSGFDYAFPVRQFALESQRQSLTMAYLDVAPSGTANGRVALLLHGKNFCAGTWESTIRALSQAGYRVIAPDQIGFCKSTKPRHYQFSFAQLAANTRALLQSLGVESSVVVGHSMGGMLAARYALQYPDTTEHLVLVNPIGLEDTKALGGRWQDVNNWYASELKTTHQGIRDYQQQVYYGGAWKPEYQRWVEMLGGMYAGPDKALVAWNQALLSDMVYNQPVLYEFGQIRVPTTLLIGQKDRTAFGRALAPAHVAKTLGDYPALGKRTAQSIPNAVLVEFEDLGHSPQVEAPARFERALLQALAAPTSAH